MAEEEIKLVLNIDTPSFFQDQRKRAPEYPVIFPAKRRKIGHSTGKPYKPKFSRLKIASSLQALKDTRLLRDKEDAANIVTDFSNSVLSKNLKDNKKFSTDHKQKVSFNSTVEILSSNKESSKATKLDGKAKNERKVPKSKPSSGKSVRHTASLFRKNPDIPSIPQNKSPTKSKKQVFSTLPFSELDISSKLVSTLEKMDYTSMTLVQHLSLPVILGGSDTLVKSQTGSGKTLAYAIPIIHKLMMREPKVERKDGVYALIIVPTRELAIQTYQWLEKLCKTCVWVVPGYLMGGEKKKAEKARLRRGVNILVATPGRLMDHINNTCSLHLSKVEYLVFDEADRMFDLGYEKAMTCIINSLNNEQNAEARQTLLLSATLTSAVEKLAGISLRSPKVIDVTADTSVGEDMVIADSLVTPENLSQYFMLVPVKLRLVTLAAFIIEKCKFSEEKKIVVFMTTQDMVDYHTSLFAYVLSKIGKAKRPALHEGPNSSLVKRANKVLKGEVDDGGDEDEDDDEDIDKDDENDISFVRLHGNMKQPERTAVFKSFHEATSGVLFCTDVASRGLDLPKVNWIVQFNPAHNPTDYVHRVGRTARASMTGSAVVFVAPSESNYVTMMEEQGIKFNQLRMEEVLKNLTRSSLYNKYFEKLPAGMEIAATRLQDKFENAVESDRDLRDMAIQGYVSFIRSYAAIPKAAREHFCFKLLHLGHYAKSFALRDAPSVLGAKGAKIGFKREKPQNEKFVRNRRKEGSIFGEQTQRPLLIQRVFSEFDSGLD